MGLDVAVDGGEFGVVVAADRVIFRSNVEIYDLLADLRRHWPLLGGDLIEAEAENAGTGAVLMLQGPLPWIRRAVRTHVTHADPHSEFGGVATTGASSAAIDWRLTPLGAEETTVSITVSIDAGSRGDRALLAVARPWLQTRCAQVLARLDAELARDGSR